MDNKSFDSKRIALGYAKRPWLHKSVIEQLLRDCNFDDTYKSRNGLDVGCGAGLSTKALRLICDNVTGTDIADSMIDVCRDLYGEDKSTWFIDGIKKYHRMFSTIVNTLIESGFTIEKMVEPLPEEELLKRFPEHKDLFHKPDFLVIKARKF